MKILSIEEIHKFLSKDEICEILSQKLVNEVAEETMEKYNGDKEIYVSTIGGEPFSNLNWRYYRQSFKKSQPKKISIISYGIDDFSGLGEIKTLEVFVLDGRSAGNHLDSLRMSRSKLTLLLKELSHLPKLRYVSLKAIFSDQVLKINSSSDLFSKLEKDLQKKFSKFVKTEHEFSFSERFSP